MSHMWSLKETNLIPFDAQLRAKNNSLGVRRLGGGGLGWWNGVTLDKLSSLFNASTSSP